MLSFNELFATPQQLDEKLIMINNGANYGQVVFLAGGAGSGKGFAISQYMEGNKFKVRDVDEWKKLAQSLSAISSRYKPEAIMQKYGDKFSEEDRKLIQQQVLDKKLGLNQLDLRNPQHVYILHILVDAINIKDKTLSLFLKDAQDRAKKGILDNVMFDITAKNIGTIEKVIPTLLKVGYDPKNIHIVWVLTDYSVAVKQNASRDRVVPDDILLQTHEGAALTMDKITRKGYTPAGMDGSIYVVLGGAGNSIIYTEKDRKYSSKKDLKGGGYISVGGDAYDGGAVVTVHYPDGKTETDIGYGEHGITIGGKKYDGALALSRDLKLPIRHEDNEDYDNKAITVKSNSFDKETGKREKTVVIKDFNYIQLKKPGKPIDKNNKVVQAKLYQWVLDNIPKTDSTRHLWPK